MYGQGVLELGNTQWQTIQNFQQDGNFANWRPNNEFERDSRRPEFPPWECEGSRVTSYSQVKRSLYRSHSE